MNKGTEQNAFQSIKVQRENAVTGKIEACSNFNQLHHPHQKNKRRRKKKRNNFVQHTLYEVIRYFLGNQKSHTHRFKIAEHKDCLCVDGGCIDFGYAGARYIFGNNKLCRDQCCQRERVADYCVITSYSIHYTKLYDPVNKKQKFCFCLGRTNRYDLSHCFKYSCG